MAEAAELDVVVAGEAAAIARVEPLLWPSASGSAARCPPERANVVKLAGNFMIASALETIGEASALVRTHGISAGDSLDVLTKTLFASPDDRTYGGIIAEQRYTPAAFKLALGFKDVRLALQAAEAAQVPLPFDSVLRDHFLEAIAAGNADHDWAALAEISARHAGLSGST